MAFLNSDETSHNVHLISVLNDPLNQTVLAGKRLERTFDEAEAIKVTCDMHTWMKSWVVVTDATHWAVTDDEGRFSLAGLPAGEHEVTVWHETLGKKTSKVTVGEDGKAEALEVKLAKKKSRSGAAGGEPASGAGPRHDGPTSGQVPAKEPPGSPRDPGGSSMDRGSEADGVHRTRQGLRHQRAPRRPPTPVHERLSLSEVIPMWPLIAAADLITFGALSGGLRRLRPTPAAHPDPERTTMRASFLTAALLALSGAPTLAHAAPGLQEPAAVEGEAAVPAWPATVRRRPSWSAPPRVRA